MAEVDDLRNQIDQASQSGDLATVARLSTRYRDLQAAAGQLPVVGHGFQAQTGREYQLATRALQLRRAGREADAVNLIRTISRERVAREFQGNNNGGVGVAFGQGVNHSLLNVGNYAQAGFDTLFHDPRDTRTFQQRLQDLQLTSEQIRHEHPVSSTAGELAGIVATLPAAEATVGRVAQGASRVIPGTARLVPVARASEIGAEARAAQIAARGGRVGQIVRGGARSALAGGTYGGAYGASDAAAAGRDPVQGAVEGAETGAAGGAVLRGAGEAVAPVATALGQRLMQNGAVRQLAARLQEPVQDIVARMVTFQQRMGRVPSAAEIIGERNAREVGASISGHGNAVETAISRSEAVQRQRPADLSAAIAQGRAPVAAADVNADASAAFSQTMRNVGDHRVSLSDDELNFLTGRDARRLFRGSLQDVGSELQRHAAARQTLADAQSNLVNAQANARAAAQQLASERARVPNIASAAERVRAKQALPGLERQAQRLAAAANDARARVAAAAADVHPAVISLRDLENVRHAAGQAAGDGAMYFMNDVADRARSIAANAGRPGAEYERGLQALAEGKSQAEGVTAGRSVVRTGGQAEPVAQSRATPAAATGARQGVNTQLQEQAAQGPGGYRRTAEDLATNTGLQRGLEQTVGPTEAARLQATGQVANDAANSLEAATPRHSQSMADEAAQQTRNWTNAAVVLSGHTGGAFKAHWTQQVISRLGISPQAANHLAELAFDPARAGEFVNLLARYSGSATRLRQTMENLAGLVPAQAARAAEDAKTQSQRENAGNDQPAEDSQSQAQQEPVQVGDVSNEYLDHLAQVESSGNANATNPNSSAVGLHQFTEATWLQTLRDHGAEVGLQRLASHINADGSVDDPQVRAQILALRTDPDISREVARAFTADNMNQLEGTLGREPSPGELYAAHFLGITGAKRLISLAEGDNTSAAAAFPKAARANRTIFYDGSRARTARQVLDVLESKWA